MITITTHTEEAPPATSRRWAPVGSSGQRRAMFTVAFVLTVIVVVASGSLQVSGQFGEDSIGAGVSYRNSRQQQEQFQRYKSKQLTANAASGSNRTSSSATSATPYWRRPGCHLVGHTRTISIPGCVKFNLSTNACRGYCMSYSIPSAADLGPIGSPRSATQPSSLQAAESLVEQTKSSSSAGKYKLDWRAPMGRRNSLPPSTESGADETQTPADIEPALVVITDEDQNADSVTTAAPVSSAASAARPLRYSLQQLQQHLASRHPIRQSTRKAAVSYDDTSANDYNTGTSAQRVASRDIVSVGQCCNMMETEDVFVNLRCGTNETRRLVFRSAKTCECFFCKHV